MRARRSAAVHDVGGRRSSLRWLWALGGYLSLGLALLGAVVPVLPSTPFALLAAYCAARGSERLHARLLAHRVVGPVIRDWADDRSVARRSKLVATGTMALSAGFLLLVAGPSWVLLGTTALMATVATWLWTRPEP